MTNETEPAAPAPAGVLNLAFCPVCDAAFLKHDGRPWSPCHAAEPINELDLIAFTDAVNLVAEDLAPLLALGPANVQALINAVVASPEGRHYMSSPAAQDPPPPPETSGADGGLVSPSDLPAAAAAGPGPAPGEPEGGAGESEERWGLRERAMGVSDPPPAPPQASDHPGALA